jgi:hypothetical protein
MSAQPEFSEPGFFMVTDWLGVATEKFTSAAAVCIPVRIKKGKSASIAHDSDGDFLLAYPDNELLKTAVSIASEIKGLLTKMRHGSMPSMPIFVCSSDGVFISPVIAAYALASVEVESKGRSNARNAFSSALLSVIDTSKSRTVPSPFGRDPVAVVYGQHGRAVRSIFKRIDDSMNDSKP